MALTKEKFEKAYKENYLKEKVEKIEDKLEELKKLRAEKLRLRSKLPPSIDFDFCERLVQSYRKVDFCEADIKDLDAEIIREVDKTLFFYNLVIPKFDPENRKINVITTCVTRFSKNLEIIRRLFALNKGEITDSLAEADTGVYWGDRLCDFKERVNAGEEGYPVINDILTHVQKRDITALLFYDGESAGLCVGYCPEYELIKKLQQEGKNIIEFPLGRPYQRMSFSTTE